MHGFLQSPESGDQGGAAVAAASYPAAMWTSRRVFGGSPDTFKLQLEYGSPSVELPSELRFLHALDFPQPLPAAGPSRVRLPVVAAALEFEFNSDEAESAVSERFAARKAALLGDRAEERVQVRLLPRYSSGMHGHGHGQEQGATMPPSSSTTTIWANHQSPAAVHAAALHGQEGDEACGVALQLSVAVRVPVLRCVTFSRTNASGSPSEAVLLNLMSQCDLSTVWKVKSEWQGAAVRRSGGGGRRWCYSAGDRCLVSHQGLVAPWAIVLAQELLGCGIGEGRLS